MWDRVSPEVAPKTLQKTSSEARSATPPRVTFFMSGSRARNSLRPSMSLSHTRSGATAADSRATSSGETLGSQPA